jgi:hypothetical protein
MKTTDLLNWVVVETSEVVDTNDRELVEQVFSEHPDWKPPVYLGDFGIISTPLEIGNIRYEPEPLDFKNCNIKRVARVRINAILKSGAQGTFYIGHEIEDPVVKIPVQQILKTLAYVAGAIGVLIGAAVLAIAAVATLAVIGTLLIPMILLMGLAVGIDPSIVFVTQSEGEWLEVCSYLS